MLIKLFPIQVKCNIKSKQTESSAQAPQKVHMYKSNNERETYSNPYPNLENWLTVAGKNFQQIEQLVLAAKQSRN